MSKRAVIIQSNYIPWKGYFDLLAHADVIVYLDSVQSTKNDWRNRNLIRNRDGKIWLTIPIRHSNALRIRDVEVADRNWAKKHCRSIEQSYARAPYADSVLPGIREWYEQAGSLQKLSAINRLFLSRVCDLLRIAPELVEIETLLSESEHDELEPTARLVEICRRAGATQYLSGPAAKSYLDENLFNDAGIEVQWFNYDNYAEYPSLFGDFDHAVSILDLLLMTGPDARSYAIRPVSDFLKSAN